MFDLCLLGVGSRWHFFDDDVGFGEQAPSQDCSTSRLLVSTVYFGLRGVGVCYLYPNICSFRRFSERQPPASYKDSSPNPQAEGFQLLVIALSNHPPFPLTCTSVSKY